MSALKYTIALGLGIFLADAVGAAQAALPDTAPMGNPGNKADTTGFGAVAYEYRIGKYEVTNAEYCEFLNAVAKTDTHSLYDPKMDGGPENWGGNNAERVARRLRVHGPGGHGQEAGELGHLARRASFCQLAHQRPRRRRHGDGRPP